MSFSFLGKYKSIIVSIALFLCLDASVLILNFYISFEISEDAAGVNLAGRQRMLSQRMVKSLINIDYVSSNETEKNKSLNELKNTVELFDKTLIAFSQGGTTIGAQENNIDLSRVTTPAGIDALLKAQEIWLDYKKIVDTLLLNSKSGLDFKKNLNTAISYANDNNLTLLSLMNTLTGSLEKVASSKASRLRIIQTIGISLAILNFFIIMFHFIKQLRESDDKIELARQETSEILDTVNEGLFLIDKDLIIGSQHSKKILDMFGHTELSNISFENLLENIVNKSDLDITQRFIHLLYREDIKSELISDLNPLKNVQVNINDGSGFFKQKHFSFNFSRVYEKENIKDILTTVRDITEEVRLTKELSETQKKSDRQFEVLAEILHASPDTLRMFLQNCFQSYSKVNELLKKQAKTSLALKEKLREISREMHSLKGESSALNLSGFEGQIHEIEDQASTLYVMDELTGEDFFGLIVEFEKLIRYTESMDDLSKKLISFTEPMQEKSQEKPATLSNEWDHLYSLVKTVSSRSGKKVDLVLCGFYENSIDKEMRSTVNDIAIQCIRNAIVHGIESEKTRIANNKSPRGRIDLRLTQSPTGAIELYVQDDGQGLNYESIRKKALEVGSWNNQQLSTWNNQQLASLIFHPGFSTTNNITSDSGRGVGMDIVKSKINAMGGKIRLGSRRGSNTSIAFSIPQPLALSNEEAA